MAQEDLARKIAIWDFEDALMSRNPQDLDAWHGPIGEMIKREHGRVIDDTAGVSAHKLDYGHEVALRIPSISGDAVYVRMTMADARKLVAAMQRALGDAS